ncbi:MAG: dipeptide/oligopeptide/nickel ABC transporter ATP-binding protein [Oscillospiraceae bacterium]|jgi:ABC-type glutathione transport system ATPase component|nr:dipeptide/oligopeptide/nickel ABC transporter ATP-binding protein [Oscillospiraceae bacterium]
MRIELREISKGYASIKGLNLIFEGNCAAALVGESGSGKSTLARMMTFLERPDSGEILFDGVNITRLRGKRRRLLRADLQLVPQNAAASLDPRLSVGKSIAEPLRNLTNLSGEEIRRRVETVCEQTAFPAELLPRLPHELSGGQLKRVCFARALAPQPGFVIFDETTGGLDPHLRERALDLIIRLKKDAMRSFLFITHDMDAALRVADRILIMRGGSILDDAHADNGRVNFLSGYAKLLIESDI